MKPSEKIIVSVNEGKIQGFKNKSPFSGAEFYSFLGVPYGQSTAGYARFKDPVEVKPWKNVLNASVEKGGCFQFSLREKKLTGSEDCLYNCIHTPKLPQKSDQSLKAVIINLHPGADHTGSPDPSYFGSPDYVMHNDIVYVCVSFRLHILGFLNLGMKECTGNQAVKDIILSLKWVQKNIRHFGGDPDNVTLLGSSSGADLVHHIMLSPPAKGLFHKAVIMGLYKYCPSTILRDENFTVAYNFGQNMGYTGPQDRKKLLSFYKKVDMTKIIFSRPERFTLDHFAPFYPASPFLMTNDFGEDPVIPAVSKEKDLESLARIPLLIGFCEKETAMGFLPIFVKSSMDNFYTSIRQNFFGWGSKLNDSQLELLRNRIDSYYLNGTPLEKASLDLKCDIQTDVALSDLYTSLIDVIAADCPSSVYVYKFEFVGNVSKFTDFFKLFYDEGLSGTFHIDDYAHWTRFRIAEKEREDALTPETVDMVNTFTKLVSTFAKTGNPNYDGITTQWKPTTVENPCYMSINENLRMVESKLNSPRMEFWEELKKEVESYDPTSEITDQLEGQHLSVTE